jgi:hypothetical protein
VVITRYQNMISISIDGNKGNTFNGVGYDLYMAATKTLTIGNDGAGSAGFQGYIRDFKINVGAGFDVTTLSNNLPTGPATADASTKLLLLHSPDDISGSATVTGGGHVMEKIPSSNVVIQTADSPNGSDYGSVNLLSGVTGLKVDSKFNRVSVMNPGGEFPVNGTGQYTVQLNASSEGVLFTIPNNEYNLVYIKLEDGYTGSGSQAIELGYPPRPGMEMTVINNSPNSVDVIGWDGPSYSMMAWESIKLMSLSDPGYGNYWWVTSSFTW